MRVFYGKIMEWLKNHWVVASIIFVFLVVAGWIFAELMGWTDIINSRGATSKGDLLRNLILCIGAIGGVVGLHIAIERQDKFSKQVQVQIDQSFNDKLGRGVQLLADEKVVMRCAGVQILKDLAENADEKQKPIIAKIIYDFFRDNARVKYDSHGNQYSRSEEDGIQDLQDALEILVNLPLSVRVALRANRESQLDFRSLDFSYLTIKCENLEYADCSNSCFYRTDFFVSEIGCVEFENANFKDVSFFKVKFTAVSFKDVNFTAVSFTDVNFTDVNFMEVRFTDVDFSNVRLSIVRFNDTSFMNRGFTNADLTNVDFTDSDFTSVNFMDSTLTNVDLDTVKFENGKFKCINFINSEIDGVWFTDVHVDDIAFKNVKFREVKFVRGHFYSDNTIRISSNLFFPYFVGANVYLPNLKFDAGIQPKEFFDLCYYSVDKWSSGAYNPICKNRGYKRVDPSVDVFVKSSKDWSECPVRMWLKVEDAERQLDYFKRTGADTSIIEVELKRLKKECADFKSALKQRKTKRNKT